MRCDLFFDHALLPSGWARDVRISVADGVIASVAHDATCEGAQHTIGIAVPGLPNLHCHAFQRGMAGIDRLLQHPAIEVQPGKLAIDEALGAGADRWTGLGIPFFFFNYSGLRGFHQISIHPKVNGAAAPAETVQTMLSRRRFNDIDVPAACAVKMRAGALD